MENKKINVFFYSALIIFIAIIVILINDFNARRAKDLNEFAVNINSIVKLDNDRIRALTRMLVIQEKENQDLRDTLAETRNSLEALGKKLVPAIAPIPATATK